MAPYYLTYTDTCASNTQPTRSSTAADIYFCGNYGTQYPVETTDEKKKRIAKEKMHASWKMYQQKTPTIIRVKQICKPIHRINYRLK